MSIFERLGMRRIIPAFLLMVAACTSSERKPGEVDVVRVARSTLLSNAPMAIGDLEGYFADEGIRLQLVDVPSRTTQALPGLEEGDIDVLSAVLTVALINAVNAGADFRIVADRGYLEPGGCEPLGIIGRKSLFEGKAVTAELLRGRKISTNAVGASGFFASKFLESYGLTLSDLDVVRLPPNVEPQALDDGSVDIVTRGDPQMHALLVRGHRLIGGAMSAAPRNHLAVLVYGPTLLSDHELGVRFMRAYLRAVRRYNQGATPRNVAIVSRGLGIDSTSLRDMCWSTSRPDGSIDRTSIMNYLQWAVGRGLLEQVIDPDRLVDPSFAVEADAGLASEARPEGG